MAETSLRILDAAEGLIKQRGINAVSFADLSEVVGIRTASIHYHFPTKQDLALALMRRYLSTHEARLAAIEERAANHGERLLGLIEIFRELELAETTCLAGSFAMDLHSLPWALQVVVRSYFDVTEQWVERTVRDGLEAREFLVVGAPGDFAVQAVATLQGALVVARARKSERTVARVGRALLGQLGVRAGSGDSESPGPPNPGTDRFP